MRAAVLHEYGVPRADDFEEPRAEADQAVVEVLAAGLNPVDVAICAGAFYAGRPPLPSVAGREGVGMLEGERVYFDTPILAVRLDGRARADRPGRHLSRFPTGSDDVAPWRSGSRVSRRGSRSRGAPS